VDLALEPELLLFEAVALAADFLQAAPAGFKGAVLGRCWRRTADGEEGEDGEDGKVTEKWIPPLRP
jgi:hypothetical protein